MFPTKIEFCHILGTKGHACSTNGLKRIHFLENYTILFVFCIFFSFVVLSMQNFELVGIKWSFYVKSFLVLEVFVALCKKVAMHNNAKS